MSFLLNPYAFATAGGSTLPVTDNFNRADDASSLGTASDTTHVWTAQNGTLGISSNRGYSSSIPGDNHQSLATVETGASDCTIEVTLPTMLSSAQTTGIIFRLKDADEYYRAYYDWGADQLRLYKFTGGGFFSTLANVALPAPPAADNTKLKVVLLGTSIKVYHENVEKISVTDSAYQTETKHGIYAGHTNSRLDDFSIVA